MQTLSTMRRIHFSLLFAAVLIAACTLSFGAPTSKTPRPSSEFRESLVAKTSGLVQSVQAANGHLAWAEQHGSSTVHLDGVQQGRKYDAVEYLEFNPDGGHLAFFAQSDQNQSAWFLVLDGQPRSEAFPTVRSSHLPADGLFLGLRCVRQHKSLPDNCRWPLPENLRAGNVAGVQPGR